MYYHYTEDTTCTRHYCSYMLILTESLIVTKDVDHVQYLNILKQQYGIFEIIFKEEIQIFINLLKWNQEKYLRIGALNSDL